MGIMHPEELEKLVYDSIIRAGQARKRLLMTDFFSQIMHEFNNDWQKYCDFLESLQSSGFIQISGTGARSALEFGPEGKTWRAKLEQSLPSGGSPMPHQTIHIHSANTVNAAGRDITITFNNTEAEQLMHLLKDIINSHPEKTTRFSTIKALLDSGKSAVEIMKGIVSLVA